MADIFVSKPEVKSEEKSKGIQYPRTRSERERLPGHNHNPLTSYCYFPDKLEFETRQKDERVVLFLRKHPITNLGWLVAAFLMILAPIMLIFFPFFSYIKLPPTYQAMAIMGWYMITTAYAVENFLSWYFNVEIVTDERIVDIDFHNLIYKEVSDANIDRIQDVTYKMGGVARTIFNYGDVHIQTAAEVAAFDFNAVPNPDKVAKVLQELRIEEQQEALEGRVS